jgi:hypothetical protein
MSEQERISSDELVLMIPKLEPADLEGEYQVLLTIAKLTTHVVKGDKLRTLTFSEHPEKGLRLNNTQLITLVKHLGDAPAGWVGKHVPVAIVNAEYDGKVYPKLYVVETNVTWPTDLVRQAWT